MGSARRKTKVAAPHRADVSASKDHCERGAASDAEQASLAYAARGWPVLPLHGIANGHCTCGRSDCPSPAKHPLTPRGLNDASTDRRTITEWFRRWPQANVGVITGPKSGLLVLDVDSEPGEIGLDELQARYGPLPDTVEQTTGRGRQLFFSYPSGMSIRNKAKLTGYEGLDVRGDGGYVVVPPSRHVNGREYTWEVSNDPHDGAEPAALPAAWLALLGAADRNAKAPESVITGITKGCRNDTLTRIAGSLRRYDCDTETIIETLAAVNGQRCNPPLPHNEVEGIARSVSRYPPNNLPEASWESFPTNMLPEPVCTYVRESAREIGCDESYVAVAILAALAGAVGGARSVYIKRGWLQPCTLWCMFVGESGTMKDAALRAAVTVLQEKEIESHNQHREAVARYADALGRYKDAYRKWKQHDSAGAQPQPPMKPVCRRYLVDDTTIEALGVTLEENRRGVLAAYPEQSTWFRAVGEYKHGRGSDDLKWARTYDAGFLQVDRKDVVRPRVVVPHAIVSVVGGIQPGILKGELIQRRFESGCVARFWIVYPPEDKVVQWSDFEVDDRTDTHMRETFLGLLNLEPRADGTPGVVRLSDAARQMLRDYVCGEHTRDVQTSSAYLRRAYAKDKGRVARLALVLHLVKTVRHNYRPSDPLVIEADTMRNAIELVRWFKHETARVYAWLGETEQEDPATRKLLEFIGGKGGVVTVREVLSGCRRLSTADDARGALQRLVDTGQGCWERPKPGPKGGAPSELFHLVSHPRIYNTSDQEHASGGIADADAADGLENAKRETEA